jgi:predicted N-acetyltransferase YhbS
VDNTFKFRPAEPDDSPALAHLVSSSPSTGPASFAYDYQAALLDVHRAFADDLHAIVATAGSSVIGMVLADVRPVQWEGQVCQAAYVSNLRVVHGYRRQGVARGMLRYGNTYLETLMGADAMVYTAIPEGNVSLSLAEAYGCQTTGAIQGGVVPMLRSVPAGKPGLTVRAVDGDDLAAVANGMNNFYREHNLWTPVTPSLLDGFRNTHVAGIHPNALYVATHNHRITAGLSVSNRTELIRMKIANLPAYARVLGSLLGILPKDGLLRALTVRHVWFADGSLERRFQTYLRPDLLVLEDFGLKPLHPPAPEDLYDVINERYERGVILLTSNRAPEEWPDLFGSPLLASAGLDRLTHRAHMIVITGSSFRAHGTQNPGKKVPIGSTP